MKIVSARKGGKNRVEVIFDDGQIVTFAYEIFLKYRLKTNHEISSELFTTLINEDINYQLKQLALKYISRRAYSKEELRKKLIQQKFDNNFIEKVLDELEIKNLINDESYARLFADEKIKSKRWGKNKIKAELIKRGISADIISDVLNEKFSDESEIEKGMELAKKKLKQLIKRKIDSKKIQVNIYSFLVSRGYDYDSCKQIVEKLLREKDLIDF